MSHTHPLNDSVVNNGDDWDQFKQDVCRRLTEDDLRSDAAQDVTRFLDTEDLMGAPIDERWTIKFTTLLGAVRDAFAFTMSLSSFPHIDEACHRIPFKPQEGWKACISSEQRAVFSSAFPRLVELFDYSCDWLYPHLEALSNRLDENNAQINQLMLDVITTMPMLSRDSSYLNLESATDVSSQATPLTEHANDDTDSFADSSDSYMDDHVAPAPRGPSPDPDDLIEDEYTRTELLPSDATNEDYVAQLPIVQRLVAPVAGPPIKVSTEGSQDVRAVTPPDRALAIISSQREPEPLFVGLPESIRVRDLRAPHDDAPQSATRPRTFAAEDTRSRNSVPEVSQGHSMSNMTQDMSLTRIVPSEPQTHLTADLTSGTMEDMSMTGVVSPEYVRKALSSTAMDALQRRPTVPVEGQALARRQSMPRSRSSSRSPSRAGSGRPSTPAANTRPRGPGQTLSKSETTKAPTQRPMSSTPISKGGERRVSDGTTSSQDSSALLELPSGLTIMNSSGSSRARRDSRASTTASDTNYRYKDVISVKEFLAERQRMAEDTDRRMAELKKELKADFKEALDRSQQAHEAEIARLSNIMNASVQAHRDELERLSNVHRDELERLSKAHRDELERLSKAHHAEVERLSQSHQAQNVQLLEFCKTMAFPKH